VNQLEHEREMRGNSSIVKSLRHQLEDVQASETSASKAQKRLAVEVEELQVQVDELSRNKHEVCSPCHCTCVYLCDIDHMLYAAGGEGE